MKEIRKLPHACESSYCHLIYSTRRETLCQVHRTVKYYVSAFFLLKTNDRESYKIQYDSLFDLTNLQDFFTIFLLIFRKDMLQ